MKTNKVFKWLYGVFMFLPMLAIGVTCAYVTFNKNAKDSYSDNETTNEYVELDTLPQSDVYLTFNSNGNFTSTRWDFYISNVEYVTGALTQTQLDSLYVAPYIRVWHDSGYNNNYCTWTNLGTNLGSGTPFTIKCNVTGVNTDVSNISNNFIYRVTQANYLDNAFYYAVDQFNESGFNKVDFVSYFDMFYNNTSIWTTFANTYMNYVLFVSLAFFIPRVLFWFINFAFSLVDGFSNKYKEW